MPPGDAHGRTFGTDAAGFRLWRETAPSTLRIACWGYWPPEVASAFARETAAVLKGLPMPMSLFLDASSLRPQGDAGQQALLGLMKALAQLQIAKAKVIVSDVLMKMQLVRLANACSTDMKTLLGLSGST